MPPPLHLPALPTTTTDATHIAHLTHALELARRAPLRQTNYRVGAVLISSRGECLAEGYTLECEGNTHAEQCCLIKLARREGMSGEGKGEGLLEMEKEEGKEEEQEGGQKGNEELDDDEVERRLREVLPVGCALYTTMEPCSHRLSGNRSCVDRIIGLRGRIEIVYVGVLEPETFVQSNDGRRRLMDAGIQVVHVPGLEEEILKVATAGHTKS